MTSKEVLEKLIGNGKVVVYLCQAQDNHRFHIGNVIALDDVFLALHDFKCGRIVIPLQNIETIKKYHSGVRE